MCIWCVDTNIHIYISYTRLRSSPSFPDWPVPSTRPAWRAEGGKHNNWLQDGVLGMTSVPWKLLDMVPHTQTKQPLVLE